MELKNKIIEYCPYCECEVEIDNKGSKCTNCGKWLKPCSLCNNDIVKCNNCPYKNIENLNKIRIELQNILENAPKKENCSEFENNIYNNMENLLKNLTIYIENKNEINNIQEQINKKVRQYSIAQHQYNGDNILSDKLEGEIDSLELKLKEILK